MGTFNTIPHFKFWCQKVLPLVYDDSLSYMELLCKVISYLNHVIDDVNKIPDYIKELIEEGGLEPILNELLEEMREQIVQANEGTSTTATRDRDTGALVWLDNKLARITRDMLAGDRYVEETEGVTGNFVYTTIELEIQREARNRQYQDERLQNQITQEVTDRTSADGTLQTNIDNEASNRQYQDERLQTQITANLNKFSSVIKYPSNRRVIFISDSYGLQEDSDENLLAVSIATKAKISDYIDLHKGGIGFTAVNNVGTFEELLIESSASIDDKETVTDIIVLGGANDYGDNIDNIEYAIGHFCNYCAANYPNALISIGHIGTNRINIGYLTHYADYSINAYKQCGKFGAKYLHNSEFILHSTVMLKPDKVHPSALGVDYLSECLSQAIYTGTCDVTFKHTPALTLNEELGTNYTSFSLSYNTPLTVEITNSITNVILHHGSKLILNIPANTLSGSTKNMNVVLADLSVIDVIGDGIMSRSIALPAKLENASRQQVGTATGILYINADGKLAFNLVYNNQESAIADTTVIEVALAGSLSCGTQYC